MEFDIALPILLTGFLKLITLVNSVTFIAELFSYLTHKEYLFSMVYR